MTALPIDPKAATPGAVTLDDKYTLEAGRVYVSGIQALVRLPMLQKERDRRAGLDTAGFISGYRGSPLGGYDMALWQAQRYLAAHDIVFQPGVNEDLAATAVWGSQQTDLFPGARFDGVFGLWYGKGPGVDRSMDVLKHANSAGSSRHGGVLALTGDDHAAKSSSLAHQSEHVLIACAMPVLYPANVQEYLDFGLHGWAMSRYAGTWTAMKCVTDVVESSASVEVDPERVSIVLPEDFEMPAGGLNIRWPDPPLAQEVRLLHYKCYAALAYVRANRLNRVVIDSPHARFGIITAGKAYLDVRQALADLGLDEAVCRRIGIRVLKVGCVWPLEARDAREFATGLDEILVVEEKRQILEYALKEELYNWREDVRPRVFGKFDERDNAGGEWSVPRGEWLLPARYELTPAMIAKAIARRLHRAELPEDVRAGIAARMEVIEAKEREIGRPHVATERKPWFCPGCPHNTSTRVPEGSRAMAGIGCHYMAMWMDRRTQTFSQMGGEGVAWIGQMHFCSDRHVFVNLGDGTYFHSGLLAIRAAIAANANVTYKILYNDAVAMTGGQPVDGRLSVAQIAEQVVGEGAKRVLVVTDAPRKYRGVRLPRGVRVHHRDDLDALQLELRETPGTTVLIYDQTCAAELRRRRKRGKAPDPPRRVYINPAVCEGCGDCSVVSNCLAVEPLATALGVKRRINQSACNKDFSCLKGFCPSFVTAEGAVPRKPARAAAAGVDLEALPEPERIEPQRAWGILVTGVGGTGVVTIGALLGMAAHLDGKGVTVLDMTGLAQKGGAVMSHVQIAPSPEQVYATRIAAGEAEVVIGCDAIVTAADEALAKTRHGMTRAVVNSAVMPTSAFIADPDWRYPLDTAEADIRASVGETCEFIDAGALALRLLGDGIYANPLLLGYAWQRGWIPLTRASLLQAIELNGVKVADNRAAFGWGRYVALHGSEGLDDLLGERPAGGQVVALPETLDALIEHRAQLLRDYQDEAWAARYTALVARLRAVERERAGGAQRLTRAVASNLARLMTYKDEYEVARLYSAPEFLAGLRETFDGEPGRDYRLYFHLAPPLLARRDHEGHLRKRRFGPWMMPVFRALAALRWLRGTRFDPFAYSAERRAERALLGDYEALLEEFCSTLTTDNLDVAVELASLPEHIRGFGHVKQRNLAAARERWHSLLARYRGDSAPSAAA